MILYGQTISSVRVCSSLPLRGEPEIDQCHLFPGSARSMEVGDAITVRTDHTFCPCLLLVTLSRKNREKPWLSLSGTGTIDGDEIDIFVLKNKTLYP